MKGYSCSQAVAGAFCDLTDLSKEQMLKISIAFGGGFLHSRSLCGALSGMGIVLGLIFGKCDADGKKDFLKQFEVLAKNFAAENGSTNCAPLLEAKNENLRRADFAAATEEEYKSKPCLKYVLDCVKMIEQAIETQVT